jgi:predicted DNA-binding transcriptional regulator YafY
VVPYLFSFGKSLRILSPPRLKKRYQEEVAAIYANLTENEGAN